MEAARARRPRPRPSSPAPTGPTPSPPRPTATSSGCATRPRPTSAIVSRLQRHALGPSAATSASPTIIKAAAREVGATAQYAGGVPAMCDGVTQGRPGMELSLFSPRRDRHGDGRRPDPRRLRRGPDAGHLRQDRAGPVHRRALAFGHLPTIFVPGGPMTSGISNAEKARVRGLYAEGKADPRRAAGQRDEVATTAPAPAPSTAPPTPTR